MTVAVKICGIRTKAALDAALDGGADYIGLVFYPKSPRHVETWMARQLADRARGRAKIVALFVDPEDPELDDLVEAVEPDMIQLHGSETPARVRAVVAHSGRPVIKAIKVETQADTEDIAAYARVAELILFDAKPSLDRSDVLPGGNGLAFDWRVLNKVRNEMPFMLSGGLTPETVATAIAVTGAAAVDVSSGVEWRPGEKDPELIRRFLRAVKETKQHA